AINIKGSNLYARGDIHLSTHNLFMEASQDSYEAKQSSKTVSGRVSATMYGGGGGSAGLDYSKSNMKEESLSHNNAKVYAGHNIYALASNDALIKGANLRADNALALKVGHDLSLASLRDSYNYNSKSSSIGAGIGISGTKTNSDPDNPYDIGNNIVRYSNSKLSSINANYSRSKSSTTVKQTVLSSITAKQLDIEVGANTDLKGSLIAAGYYDESGNFIDNGKLRLKTDSLTFSNLSNTRYDKSNSLSIGTNYAFKDPQQERGNKEGESAQSKESKNSESKESARLKQEDLSAEHIQNTVKSIRERVAKEDSKNFSSSSVSLSRSYSVRLDKTLATVGRGNLIINNEAGSDELSRLNRDTAKIQKDIVNSNLYSSAKADIDHRFFRHRGDFLESLKSW
ncbi:MAG: hemagglutinin repeat-containing protein, partial [Capnocytophaga leadbetteri]